MSSIEWTDETWNPTAGCSRVSKGCEHCYAEGVAHRGMSPQHRGLTVLGKHGPRWNGTVRLVESALAKPLSWKKGRRVFVNSMSDLFHEALTNEQIAAVFAVMAACPQHTFQVLTKRPERAAEWFGWMAGQCVDDPTWVILNEHAGETSLRDRAKGEAPGVLEDQVDWPLPNVWLGVSVEDQATADERIPVLLGLPTALRFVSYEPALGPVTFTDVLRDGIGRNALLVDDPGTFANGPERHLDWVIVGGESGPGARLFDLAWARSTVAACKAAGVPVFVKQLGRVPYTTEPGAGREGTTLVTLYAGRNRKGADMEEWPADLRVREFPS